MVQFAEHCEVYDIEHLNDCTEEQVAAKWLTSKEWQEIRDGYNAVVDRLLAGEEFDENDEHATRRGLEPWIPEIADEKCEVIYHAVQSVLEEQELQYQDDIQDDNVLAEICCNYSRNSSEQSYRVALDDEKEANRIYKQDDEEKRKSNNNASVAVVVVVKGKSKSKNSKKTSTNKSYISSSSRKGQRGSMISQIKGAAKSIRMRR